MIAYANSIGGDYKAQPPLKVSPTPALAAGVIDRTLRRLATTVGQG